MNDDKRMQQAVKNGEMKAQEDASYINWLLMNEFTFEQAYQMFIANKMQQAFYERWKGDC